MNPSKITLISPRVADAELGLAEEVVEEVLGFDLPEPRNDGDVHVGLGIRFLSSTEYSHLFSAYDLCGTRSTWLCLFLLGPSSSKTTTLKNSYVAPRMPSPMIKAMMENFSSGMSTFNDSELNLWT